MRKIKDCEAAPPAPESGVVRQRPGHTTPWSFGARKGRPPSHNALLRSLDPSVANAARSARADGAEPATAQSILDLIGPLEGVPFLSIEPSILCAMHLDHRAGFVLSHVDGISSVQAILDVSGMRRLETVGILHRLIEQGIITLR